MCCFFTTSIRNDVFLCSQQCVPYLIAIGTDEEQQMKVKADQQLSEIDNKYSMFVQVGSSTIRPCVDHKSIILLLLVTFSQF